MSAACIIPHVDPLADAPLRLEIAKEYDPLVLQFLVNGMREQPIAFAQSQKTVFIHPDLYTSGLPDSIQELHGLCRLHAKATQKRNTSSLRPLLCQKFADLYRQLSHAATFEELLGCSQALILIKAMIILGEDDDQTPYSEAVSYILAGIAGRLWHQAPIQLPQNLSPRHAWILAESVRRTIIMAFLLRSVYSLKTRKYSVRTPFVDALPFDVRTYLWDEGTEQT
ncbi:hypothetical protein NUU61_000942 [Penicillium alfredii]|uniref:Transcription factor domain-containing protein n=1 Tax=Penicillium alfredii TaxID=1506179 RepID=A0A9W9KRI6_9EURO|nr:uncharacterized protein NUU61_000942 [Penicillium alfredii]KAJ5115183.1 hypothetical protein NUU61_000942 [Penicillium alfredii]